MNRIILLLLISFITITCGAQNFNGQWKGGFIDKSTSMFAWGGDKCDYVLDLEVNGKIVTGYSYTYFTDAGKKYYTICRLEGIVDKKKKYLEVAEVARTKTNVPVNISNSFQVHKLTWRKEVGNEILEGTWAPAAGQEGKNNGFGITTLSKRMLTEIAPLAKGLKNKTTVTNLSPERPMVAAAPSKKAVIENKKMVTVIEKPLNTIAIKPMPKTLIPLAKVDSAVRMPELVKIIAPAIKTVQPGFEKRNNTVLQTINVENAIIKLELYDNGEVDGDSVTVFYNGKILLAHARLTEKPILFEITVPLDVVNELVMYADNLGTLPPNTALMIVSDGKKRYEVRITSDLIKSGTIRFVHKKPN